MQSEMGTSLYNDLKSLLNNPFFSDIKIKGNDGEEINAHRNILAVRSEVFKRMLLSEMREATQDVIEFPEFTSDTLHIILEYLYTGKVTEKTLTIEIVAEAFHGADFFLLEQLKLQIIEFVANYSKDNVESKVNISAKILSRLLEHMGSSNNELGDLLYNFINLVPLKSIEYCNLNVKALEYILPKIKKKETEIFSPSEYDLLHYIILWAANEISNEALSFYKSYLPSSETIKSLSRSYKRENVPVNIPESHTKYQSTMTTITSSLLNYVNLEQIHPVVISNIIEPLGLINSKTLIDIYRKQALLLVGEYACSDDLDSFQWNSYAHGNNMFLDMTLFAVISDSSSHEWIRTTVPVGGQSLVEWDIMVEKMCSCFWVGICTENGFNVDYNSWLGKQAYGWVLGSNGVICHNTQEDNGPYTNKYGRGFGENDRITVHLDMKKRNCSFSINGTKYPIAFDNLPDEVYPAVSLRAPGKARIKPVEK